METKFRSPSPRHHFSEFDVAPPFPFSGLTFSKHFPPLSPATYLLILLSISEILSEFFAPFLGGRCADWGLQFDIFSAGKVGTQKPWKSFFQNGKAGAVGISEFEKREIGGRFGSLRSIKNLCFHSPEPPSLPVTCRLFKRRKKRGKSESE